MNGLRLATGDYEVVLEASNVLGSDEQMFTIFVNEIPAITSTPATSVEASELYSYTVVGIWPPNTRV